MALMALLESMTVELIFFSVALSVALVFRLMRKRAFGSGHNLSKVKKKASPLVQQKQLQKNSAPNVAAAATATATTTAAPKQNDGKSSSMTLDDFVERTISARIQTTVAITYYSELKQAKRQFMINECLAKSEYSGLDFYSAMIQCAGRAGRPHLVVDLLDDATKAGVKCTLTVYESAMKLLAAKKCFAEALQVYDRLEREGLEPSPVTFSCLVGFAGELGEADRAIAFFNKLAAKDVPSIRAYMTVLRIYSQRKDWVASQTLVKDMHNSGAALDSLALNMVLSTGVSASQVEAAQEMLSEDPWSKYADIVSYNIILKGLAQQGKTAKAIALLGTMHERRVAANHISYNTAIDAAVRGHRVDDAWRLYVAMQEIGRLAPDKCTASTMVKALQLEPSRERVEKILSMFEAVLADCPADLGARLFAGTVHVALKLKDLSLAMRVLGTLRLVKQEPSALSQATAPLLDLALFAARLDDAESCSMVWKHVLPDSPERKAVTRAVANGSEICAVTQQRLGSQPARPGKRVA
jgi:pentatricopeptide repeat protein